MSIIKANAWQRIDGTTVGTVLQTKVSISTAGNVSTSSTSWQASGMTVTITPTSASSLIICYCAFNDTGGYTGGMGRSKFLVQRTVGGVDQYVNLTENHNWNNSNVAMRAGGVWGNAVFNSWGVGTAGTINLLFSMYDGTGPIGFNHHNSNPQSSLIVQEIAQ